MDADSPQLHRLITNEIGRCYDEDLEGRVSALETLAETTPRAQPADLSGMSALGDETRYRLVRLLAASDEER
jgi:hypothetical protein